MNLSSVNLSSVNLALANRSSVNLSSVNLSSVNLSGFTRLVRVEVEGGGYTLFPAESAEQLARRGGRHAPVARPALGEAAASQERCAPALCAGGIII